MVHVFLDERIGFGWSDYYGRCIQEECEEDFEKPNMKVKLKSGNIGEKAIIVLGVLLIIDSLFLHLVSFDYTGIGAEWVDPWFDHWILGVILILSVVKFKK